MNGSLFRPMVRLCAHVLPVLCLSSGPLGFADEASPGGARQALGKAEILAKALSSGDPLDAKDAVNEATRMVPLMESMASLLKGSEEKIASIRLDFEKKASGSSSATVSAFYQSELKTMKGREEDLSDLRRKVEGMVAQIKAKVEKAKANPEVQALLKDDELLRKSKEALEKLKNLKLPSLEP
jgi:hypothetical protein